MFSAHNQIFVEDNRPRFSKLFPTYPRRETDKRERCILFTGNGFSLGLLDDLSLSDSFPCRMQDIFKSHESIRYRPYTNDHFSDEVLWSQRIWPKLTEFIASNKSSENIWQSLYNLNSDQSTGRWTLDESSLMYELRWYLWFYFYNTVSVYPDLKKKATDWSWLKPVKLLLDEFKFTHITLNYDLMFEVVIAQSLKQLSWSVLNEERESLEKLPAYIIPSIKLHGTISQMVPRDPLINLNYRNPWLNSDFIHQSNELINLPIIDVPNFADVTFNHWPWLPELVPPGRAGDDLCHPSNRALAYGKEAIADCEYLVVCGVSAAEPDTNEIRELMSSISDDTQILHIDINNPEKSAPLMSSILKETKGEYIPISSRDVSNLRNFLYYL